MINAVVLVAVLCALLLIGVALTIRWSGTEYRPWNPDAGDGGGRPSVDVVARRYLRGVAVFLVGGFWAGALVTGPAVRLVMRLLAVTAGDDAQGKVTEAEEIVGSITVDGTLGLYIFGGILPGLLSGAIYVLFRAWLPSGRLGGVAFGFLHLVIAATRIDPLRPDNPDFDLVGPGWLAVVTYALAALFHGMAVVAFANRFSRTFPPEAKNRPARTRALLVLALPVLMLIPGVFLLVPILMGLVVTVVASRIGPLVRAVRSRGFVVGGRVIVAALALVLLPGAVTDLRDVIDRDGIVADETG